MHAKASSQKIRLLELVPPFSGRLFLVLCLPDVGLKMVLLHQPSDFAQCKMSACQPGQLHVYLPGTFPKTIVSQHLSNQFHILLILLLLQLLLKAIGITPEDLVELSLGEATL